MKILVIGPSWVGDMVMSQSLYKAIKANHPECELHVMAPMLLTRAVLPGMIARREGRIITVASVASFTASPGNVNYCATKAYQRVMCEALAMELLGTGVHVTALCPGFTYTEFHDVLGNRDQMNRLPKFMWQDARAVCLAGIAGVERNRAVVVPGAFNRVAAAMCRVLPYAWTSRMIPKGVMER